MQVRQVIAAALLAVTAVGAMSQEIDPSENLQGKSLAAAAASNAAAAAPRSSPRPATCRPMASCKAVGERADAPAVAVVPQAQSPAAPAPT